MVLKVTWTRLLVTIAALVVFGLGFAWSGLIGVGAVPGHWAVTNWFLHWTMRNSVRTYAALSVQEPAADPNGLVSAAAHYAANCATCHGAPGEPLPPVMQSATPPPPRLSDVAHEWSDRELFWIIKNGVKFTAMPGWTAAGRDDEVRRMTAFVRRLPSMNPVQYRDLGWGPEGRVVVSAPTNLPAALADCERCHADNGRDQPDIPVLAGQKPDYLASALEAYAQGRRPSGVMKAAAVRPSEDIRRALADHYAGLPGGLADTAGSNPATADAAGSHSHDHSAAAGGDEAGGEDEGAANAARRIVVSGLPDLDLPACSKCHAAGKRADYPRLAGQKPEYLANRLRLWRGDPDVVDARKSNESMAMIARRIPEDMIEPLARHFGRSPAHR